MRYIITILFAVAFLGLNAQSVSITPPRVEVDTSNFAKKNDILWDNLLGYIRLKGGLSESGFEFQSDSTFVGIDRLSGGNNEGFFVIQKRDGDLFTLVISKNIQAITGLNNGQIQFIGNVADQNKIVFGGDGSIGNRHILAGFPLEQRAVFNYFRYDFLPESGGTEDIYVQFKSDSIFLTPKKNLIIGNSVSGQTIEMDSLGNYILNDVKNYADTTAADADTDLPSRGIYTLTGNRTLFIKP